MIVGVPVVGWCFKAAEYKDSALIDWNSCTSPTCTVTDAYSTENMYYWEDSRNGDYNYDPRLQLFMCDKE